ncbi:MAG TPA: formyl transferase [Acidimicrobiales bacterium]|nr:formyl transferase [Acidimicrobiales bacterium]
MTGPLDERQSGARPVVLLAGPGPSSNIVFQYLAAAFSDGAVEVVVVMERPVARLTLARRRARRLGWGTVVGQVAFVTAALPWLRRSARERVRTILDASGLDASDIPVVRTVPSVNDPETAALLRDLDPAVVVVNGTRIISDATLSAVACPFINIHAGITPRYRGVHGGYWALVEGRPDLVGTTVHLVDTGIDTGGVLARAHFAPTPADSIATYPYHHLAGGLPLLVEQVERVLAGQTPGGDGAGNANGDAESRLRWHPTLWGYLWTRLRRRVK